MASPSDAAIAELESRLLTAMVQSDVEALDALLAPDLRFTNHLGQLLTKQDDLAAHASGAVTVDSITPSEQSIRILGEVAIVTVQVRLVGSYAGRLSDARFRFTRVWSATGGGAWRVVAGHSSRVTDG